MASNSLRPIRNDQFDYWAAHHLLNRAGFGGTPSQVTALVQMGRDRAVDYIVDFDDIAHEPVSMDTFDGSIMRPPTEQERAVLDRARRADNEAVVEQFRQERQRRQQADRAQIQDVRRWWLQRMIESPRPLEEKLTLFWHGHFATGYRTIENSYDMFQQNQMFRRNAAGNFADLVFNIVRDPAMLRYLNNDQNRKQAPNENLARELMELFVLGEGNRYTEHDIKEGARALTGYTYQYDEATNSNRFWFNRGAHDSSPKRILGKVGSWDGIDFCRIILQQTVASEFICSKLHRFFVNDAPGTTEDPIRLSVIRKLARQLRDENYELRPVLKTLFKSQHFYDAGNVAALIKSPVQLIVQAVRSMHTPVRDLDALVSASELMGQHLCEPPSVKGWDGGRSWINTSTLFVRQNLLVYLLTGKRPNVYDWQQNNETFDPSHLVNHLRRPDGTLLMSDVVAYLLRFSLGQEPEPERTEALTAFIDSHGGKLTDDMIVAVLSLITATPEYQLS